ncbi:hypothetical protein GY45DRAFT_1318015 [Cubamyces sp. BRFM 1775]|nr:hypothetical protein GY45DRAFT_1318015 [Cubamyces sp. BRFM 1775]
MGQSPCEVGYDLLQTCGGSSQSAKNAPCYCNSVVYSLWAACTYCHEEGYSSFADYLSDGQCTEVGYGSYTGQVPADTVVPPWAYEFKPTPSNQSAIFDLQAAQQVASGQSKLTVPQAPPASTSRQLVTSESSTSPVSHGSSELLSQSSGTTSHSAGASTALGLSSQIPSSVSDVLPSTQSRGTPILGNTSIASLQSTTSTLGPAATTNPAPQTESPQTLASSSSLAGTGSPSPNTIRTGVPIGAVIGAAVGAAAAVCIAVSIALCLLRCRRRRRAAVSLDDSSTRKLGSSRSQHSDSDLDVSIVHSQSPVSTERRTLSKVPSPYYTVKLYDPDDPTTFPPSLSEILNSGQPVSVSGDWRGSQAQTSDSGSRDSEAFKVY